MEDLVDRVTRKNQDLVSELPLTISAQYGLIDQNEFFDKRVASKDVSGYYLIENGEFAYNKSTSTDAPWGAVKRLDRYENGVLSTLYIIFGIKEDNPVDSDFLVSYYSTNLWHKGIHEIAAEGARNHGLLNIAPADFFGTELTIPQDIEEQKKIGKYFEELETLITLHQCKCHLLLKLLHNDWEQRKLNEYFNVSTAKNKDNHYGKEDVLSVSGDYGIVNQIKFQGRSFAGATVANYGVVNTGDVVYTKSPLSTNPYGIIKANKGKAGIVSTLYAVYKPCKNVNSEFVQVYFELNSRMNNYMQPLVNKGAKNDMKITAENALKGGVCFPKLNEQDVIVEYFRSLDHLITLHQCKCHLLLKLLHNDWEQRKLNEYFNVSTAKNKDNHYGKEDVLSVSGDYGIVNQIKFQGRSFAGATVANYGVVNTGDVVYTKSPLSTNPYGIIKANKGKAGIVSTLYAVYKPCKNVNSEFVQVYFELNSRMNNYMQPLVNKGAKNDMKITAENALKGGVCFPKLNEQDVIVEYFRSLDHLITLHHRKYTSTLKSP